MRFMLSLLTTAVSFGLAQAAYAADMPVKAPVPMMAAPYNWGGWYVGGNVGYGWGDRSNPGFSFSDPAGTGFAGYVAAGGNVTPNLKQQGAIGGGQVGYNWVVSPNWVAGLVTDFQGSGMKDSRTNTVTPPGLITSNQSNSLRTDWFGTVRGKVGFAQNNWLFYGTGGLAYGRVTASGNFNFPFGAATLAGSTSQTKAGWAAGAGVDYGLTRNWTVGVEYLYYDLGRVSYTEVIAGAPASFTISNRTAASIGRATLNYKF